MAVFRKAMDSLVDNVTISHTKIIVAERPFPVCSARPHCVSAVSTMHAEGMVDRPRSPADGMPCAQRSWP